MIFKRYKIRRLFKRIVTAAIVLLLIYLVIILLDGLLGLFSSNKNQVVTPKQEREEKYNAPMMGNKKVEAEKQDDVLKIIEQYYNYCNQKNYQEAYNLLDEDCKEVLYPSLEKFTKRVDEVFDKLKLYRYKNVVNLDNKYIYQISLYDDVMAYGSSEFPQERVYIIVVNYKDDGKYTISLQGFLEKKDLNYSITNGDIQIIVESKEIYYASTVVNYKVINNTNSIIAIDKNDIKLITTNNVYEEEYFDTKPLFGESILYISPEKQQTFKAKFNKNNADDSYKEDRIHFENVYILNEEIESVMVEITKEIVENNYISKFNMRIPL